MAASDVQKPPGLGQLRLTRGFTTNAKAHWPTSISDGLGGGVQHPPNTRQINTGIHYIKLIEANKDPKCTKTTPRGPLHTSPPTRTAGPKYPFC